ncbi:MAG: MFS transporter [Chloroflexi bacterium]|nr:MFS transporter [Chloroflexota bacterium]
MVADVREPPASQPSASIWSNRAFMLLWLAQAISQTAQNAVWYGILVLVQNRSNSSAHMGVAIITLVLPSVLFGLLAGVYVDRWDKRLVLVAANALRAVAVLGYSVAGDWLGLVYLVNFAFATFSQFFAPAEASTIPAIVPRRQLLQANSLFHLTFTSSQLVGIVLLGPLVVTLVGVDGLFALVAVLFALCAALVWPLPSLAAPGKINGASATSRALEGLRADVQEVLHFFRSDWLVTLSVIHWTLGAILGVIVAMLAPGFAVKVLGIRAEDSVFVLAPAGVGMVLGTVGLSRFAVRLNKQLLINAGLVAIGVALLLLGILGDVWRWFFRDPLAPPEAMPHLGTLILVVMGVALVAGLAFVAIIVPSQTILQERAPMAVRGRVFAVALMLGNVISILPLVFLGNLADIIGVANTLLVLALLVLGVAGGSVWAGPRVALAVAYPEDRGPRRV